MKTVYRILGYRYLNGTNIDIEPILMWEDENFEQTKALFNMLRATDRYPVYEFVEAIIDEQACVLEKKALDVIA